MRDVNSLAIPLAHTSSYNLIDHWRAVSSPYAMVESIHFADIRGSRIWCLTIKILNCWVVRRSKHAVLSYSCFNMMAESSYKESENVMSVQYDKEDTIILESSRRCSRNSYEYCSAKKAGPRLTKAGVTLRVLVFSRQCTKPSGVWIRPNYY